LLTQIAKQSNDPLLENLTKNNLILAEKPSEKFPFKHELNVTKTEHEKDKISSTKPSLHL